MRRAAALGVVFAIASVAENTSALATRNAKFSWDKGVLRGDVNFDDALDLEMKKRLYKGLPVTIVMRGYVYPSAGTDPVALTAHTCSIGYDLWNEVFSVVINKTVKKSAVVAIKGVHRLCTDLKELPITDKATLKGKAQDYYLAVKVEVNPKSSALLSQIQGWVTRPLGVSGSITPGDALFATFVGVFIKPETASADLVIDFRTQGFPGGAAVKLLAHFLPHFLPEEGARPSAIRRAAARNAFLGALLVGFGAALVFAIERLTHGRLLTGASRLRFVAGLPMLVGWVIVATSAWRLAIGLHPSREPRTLARSALRLAFVTLALAALFALVLAALFAFPVQSLIREP